MNTGRPYLTHVYQDPLVGEREKGLSKTRMMGNPRVDPPVGTVLIGDVLQSAAGLGLGLGQGQGQGQGLGCRLRLHRTAEDT